MNKVQQSIDFAPQSAPLRRSIWIIFCSAAAVLLIFLGRSALIGGEGDFCEAVRELLAGEEVFAAESWWMLENNGNLWFSMPGSWAAMLLGCSEFACRLPSVICALLLLAGMMVSAEKFFDRDTMCTAAWMLIGSYGFVYWGRYASGFMFLAAWAVWTAVWLGCVRRSFWWNTVFFTVVLCGCCWWGMNYMLLLPGIVILNGAECRRAVFRMSSLAAVISAVLITQGILTVLVLCSGCGLKESPVQIWEMLSANFIESLDVFIDPAVWWENWQWYRGMMNLGRLLLPWILPSAAAVVLLVRKWNELSSEHRRLLTGTLLMILLSGVLPGRRWQYQLAQLPFVIMLTAGCISGYFGDDRLITVVNTVMKWVLSFVCSLLVAVIVTWPLWQMVLQQSPAVWLMILVPLLGVTGLGFLIFDTGSVSSVEKVSGMNGIWSGYVLAGVCCVTAVFAVSTAELSRFRTGRDFWLACRKQALDLPADEVIFYGREPDPKALFYMDLKQGCTVVSDKSALEEHLKNNVTGRALLIVERGSLDAANTALSAVKWQLNAEAPLAAEYGFGMEPQVLNEWREKYVLYQIRRK